MTTHADDELVASFQKLAVADNKLPARPDYGKNGKEVLLRTNYFPVEYGKATIYDYEVSVEPVTGIKRIMKRLLQLFMTSPEFAPYAASSSHDNMKRLVSLKEIPVTGAAQVFSVGITFFDEGDDGPSEKSKNYRISLKLVAKHDPSNMTKYVSSLTRHVFIQFLIVLYRFLAGKDASFDPQPMLSAFNIILAKYPSQHGVMVGRNKWFFPTPGSASPLGTGLEAFRGFYSSVRPSFQQLMVNVNVATTAFYRPQNLAALFFEFGQAGAHKIPTFIHHLRIEMNHTGRKMRKTIKGVKLRTNASDYKFKCDEFDGENMSVEHYFKRSPSSPTSAVLSSLTYLNRIQHYPEES